MFWTQRSEEQNRQAMEYAAIAMRQAAEAQTSDAAKMSELARLLDEDILRYGEPAEKASQKPPDSP